MSDRWMGTLRDPHFGDGDMRRAWDEAVRQEAEETQEQKVARRRRVIAWLKRKSVADEND